MYRDRTRIVFHNRVNFSCQHAAVGDTITSLPAIIEARRRNPDIELHVWVGDYVEELVRLLLAPYGEFKVVPGSQVQQVRKQHHEEGKTRINKAHKDARKAGGSLTGPVIMNAIPYDVHTRVKTDMVAFGFHALLDMEPPSIDAMNYPTAPLGPRIVEPKYVAVQAGYTAKNRAFHPDAMRPVLEWAIAQGMVPVILGKAENKMPYIVGSKDSIMKTTTQTDYDTLPETLRAQCMDLREKTTLVQARDILGHAECVVGVDGGLLHVALTTEVPVVYGFTNTAVHCRTPVRHGLVGWNWLPVVPPGLDCQGCQSNWTLVYGHDFRTCYYGDYACVTGLKAEQFIESMAVLMAARETANEQAKQSDREASAPPSADGEEAGTIQGPRDRATPCATPGGPGDEQTLAAARIAD